MKAYNSDKKGKKQSYKGITASGLKIIALILMIIDHIGAFIVSQYFNKLYYSCTTVAEQAAFINTHPFVYYGYYVMRAVGRLSFPIYCFLLVEGLRYSKNRLMYAVRLLLFAVLSEVPFDLAMYGKLFNMKYQNVFFTLFLGYVTIWAIDEINKIKTEGKYMIQLKIAASVVIAIAAMATAYYLKTDYKMYGVATIVIMYMFRNLPVTEMALGCVMLCVLNISEAYAFLAVPLIRMYNGRRGIKLKYLFYFAYPVHLVIIYLTEYALGLV